MSGTLRLSRNAITNETPISTSPSDAEAVLAMVALWPDGAWNEVRIKPSMLRYIQSEASRRGILETQLYKEIHEIEARAAAIMPSMEELDALASLGSDEWCDDRSWVDADC